MTESRLDIREQGRRDGQPIHLDRRLFMKFTAFGDCDSTAGAVRALARSGVRGALYEDLHDPRGIGVVALAEDPLYFARGLRELFNAPPFNGLRHKAEFDMLGRTYAIGYEADLEHVLLHRPLGRVLDPALPWAVWYPLQRDKTFYALSAERQRQILGEHGGIGRRFGEAGLAADVRFACHGLDPQDNDFVIGLLGAQLHPLSVLVQTMRSTEQTSQYLSRLGPFFVGHAAWRSARGAFESTGG